MSEKTGTASATGATTNDQNRGLLDTSVLIAQETGRRLGPLPAMSSVSVVTIAELHLGVLMADDPVIRAERLRTVSRAEALFEPLPVDVNVARTFATLVASARRAGRRPTIQDTWIAATAATHNLPLYTQDDTQDDGFAGIPQVRGVRI